MSIVEAGRELSLSFDAESGLWAWFCADTGSFRRYAADDELDTLEVM